MEILKKDKKQFNKIKLREIKVLNQKFFWKRGHLHLENLEFFKNEPTCIEKVVIYLADYKKSPLILFFREYDNQLISSLQNGKKWGVGYPDDGVIWLFEPPYPNNKPTISINLNKPSVISELIQYFLLNGWQPTKMNKPFIEENALKFLEIIDLPKD